MNCVLFGAENSSPVTTGVVEYNSIVAAYNSTYKTTENQAVIPLSEDITITQWDLQLPAAPGAGKSWTFTIRANGADTAATITISGTNTTGSWTGTLNLSAGDLICYSAVSAGTPASIVEGTGWQIYYTTSGNYYLMMGNNMTQENNAVTAYHNPIGGRNIIGTTTSGQFDIVCPTGVTFTKIAVSTDAAPGTGKSWAVSIEVNGSSDLTATISDTNTSATNTGSLAASAGDNLQMKFVPSGTPAAPRLGWCMTVTPGTSGEIAWGFGNFAALASDNTVYYEQGIGFGLNTWKSVAPFPIFRPPSYDFKKLYVRLATAPGTGRNRTLTMEDNGADTTLAVTISDTNTTGNDTTHTVTMSGGGNTSNLKQQGTNTPAALSGIHIGYVVVVPQPSGTSVKMQAMRGWSFPI